MDMDEIRRRALDHMYTRYEQSDAPDEPPNQMRMPETAQELGIDQKLLGRAFQELVDEGMAQGHPRPGTGMKPADGLVWITPRGRKVVEDRRKDKHRAG